MLNGSCLCGAVSFTVRGAVPGPSICHCSQCRKQSGHVWASTYAPRDDVEIRGDVTWFRASELAERGFCGTCGSFLFWRRDDEDTISFAMGSLQAPTGLTLAKHIFTADKGDYYQIADGVPQS
ncbi:GFA family protein [Actibacterium sp. D379-3]